MTYFFILVLIITINLINVASSNKSPGTLKNLTSVEEFDILKPDEDNGEAKISEAFKESLNKPDTLDTLLKFLQDKESPISSVLDLKSFLVSQKAEKIELENGLRQMGIEMEGIRLGIYKFCWQLQGMCFDLKILKISTAH